MNTKYTPGPWKQGEHDEDGQFVITNESGSAAICYGASWFGDRNDGPANAHLIAAAPELLEALEMFANSVHRCEYCDGSGVDEEEGPCHHCDGYGLRTSGDTLGAYHDARAAIAKATGQQ